MEKTSYRACIFDLDGTLADTLQSIAYFSNGTLAAFGLPPIETEEYKQMVGNGASLLIRRMLDRVGAGFSPEETARVRAEYDRRYESEPMKLVVAYPGMPELLARLKERGIKVGILSNKPDNMAKAVAAELYGGLPDAVYGQRDGVPIKPDPAGALDLAAELGVRPKDVLYIGDTWVDMDTGRSAGMDTCGVLWGFRDREELLSHGARYLAANAEELEKIIEKQ